MPIVWTLPPPTQPPPVPRWELISEPVLPVHADQPRPEARPLSAKQFEEIVTKTPLNDSDFSQLLSHSPSVPTAMTLPEDQWRISSSILSPFKYASGTGNQNYAVQLDLGLTDTFQISGFYSEADDPLNAPITGLDVRPGNFWEVYGVAARWQFRDYENLSLALNGSLESWTVGSGGNDSLGNSGGQSSPNIFNDSGQRVETNNFIGSLAIPMTWRATNKWQFTFTPGISFLPSNQGKAQGGSGQFYGTNPYISGGLLWHPIPQLGLTASVAQPFGNGTNSFDKNLKFSRKPVISGGLNWHLNPRIALQGLLTNGFGATPATALLTLPSDNRIGYSANFVFTADAPDTPQVPLNTRQQSLSLGGLTVNTALVPPDSISVTKVGADAKGNFDATYGVSISNIFHLDFYSSKNQNVRQNTPQARTYAGDGAENLRGSGKAVLTSPLRGAPVWSALRISLGRNMDTKNNTAEGYLFAETPLTWEANSKIALNISPKVAWAGVGSLSGIGLSANIQVAPRWELVPEANIVFNSKSDPNVTLGLRWNATDNIAIEAYGSTASSIVDVGQLLNDGQTRWGSRLIVKF